MATLRTMPILLFLFLALPFSAPGQEGRAQIDSRSCRNFVENFYSWYAVNASKERSNRDGVVALKHRSKVFSPAIVRALREDNEAQDKAGSDLVSLDGDPFVGADGLGERYIVERVTVRDRRCRAEVHAVWDGQEDKAPDVTPELAIKNGKWLFVNFYFPSPSDPEGWNLLSALKALREGQRR